MKKLMFLMSFVVIFAVKDLNAASRVDKALSYLGIKDTKASVADEGLHKLSLAGAVYDQEINKYKAQAAIALNELKNASPEQKRAAEAKYFGLLNAIDSLVKKQANAVAYARAQLEGRPYIAPFQDETY